MNTLLKIAVACASLAMTPALADPAANPCGTSAAAVGMRARIDTMLRQSDEIEWTADRAEQRRLLELNMKHLQEAMGQLRRRDLPAGCRIEMMSAMLEALLRNQQVALAENGR